MLNLLPETARWVEGDISFFGVRHASLTKEQWRQRRWRQIAYVPQGAIAAFDPVRTLLQQFEVTADAHGGHSDLRRRAADLFKQVELDPTWLNRYPHQLSGGMRQRAAIALALLFDPLLLVADEPTTGLDVLVQREIIKLLSDLQAARGMTLVLVSHDLGVVSELCRNVAVMYAGRIIESGATEVLLGRPAHPYTMGLRNAVGDVSHPDRFPIGIPGSLPTAPVGDACAFAPRCPFAIPPCHSLRPALASIDNRTVACHRSQEAHALRELSDDPATWGYEDLVGS
jgi:oligopeptide/dipeptide ABC transporter ATP-binding protein